MRWLIVAMLVLASPTARADDYPCECANTTAHPGLRIPAGPDGQCESADRCLCSDSCSGGPSSTQQVNPAVANGAAKILGGVVLAIGFAFLPGHLAQALSKDGPRQSARDAHKAFDDYAAKRQQQIQAGVDADKSRAAYWKLDEDERAQLRAAPTSKPKLKPFHPPKLKPDLHWMCDQAKLLMPSTHTTGPLGMFATEGEMVDKCSQFTERPVDPDPTCPATSLQCGLQNQGMEICCPPGYPIYNLCSEQCYRTTDFVAGKDVGLHCATSRDCGATIK